MIIKIPYFCDNNHYFAIKINQFVLIYVTKITAIIKNYVTKFTYRYNYTQNIITKLWIISHTKTSKIEPKKPN